MMKISLERTLVERSKLQDLQVYKCLHQLATPYPASMISLVSAVSARRHFRSAGRGDLVVPRTRTAGFDPQSFSVAGPLVWNNLPPEIKTTSVTLEQFSSRLKSEIFPYTYSYTFPSCSCWHASNDQTNRAAA